MSGEGLERRELKAIVFDLDGTLIRSTVDFRKMKEGMVGELALRGIPPSLLDHRDTIVNNLARTFTYLRSIGRGDEVDGIDRRVTELMNRTELERVDGTTAVPGSLDTLRELRGQGFRLGLLTRGSRAYALAALGYAGLGGQFEAMVCRDDYPEEEAKPNGKALRRVADRLDVEPRECLLVGDHVIDLNCARSASAPFVGVLTGAFRAEDWSGHQVPVVASVAELPELLRADK